MVLVWLALTATDVGWIADQMLLYMQIDGITINMPLIYIYIHSSTNKCTVHRRLCSTHSSTVGSGMTIIGVVTKCVVYGEPQDETEW